MSLRPQAQLRARLEGQLRLLERVRECFPPAPIPWFGHMRLHTGTRELDVLLGTGSHTAPGLSMIEWQTAPLAEVFFAWEEGESYEVDLGERVVGGKLLEKNLARFENGELVEVACAGVRWRPGPGGWTGERWRPTQLPLRAPQQRGPFRSPLEVELDPAQQRVVDLPAQRSVLLLGEAGFGKTTVALHRLVALQKQGGRKFRGAVIVPTLGLRRLTEQMLAHRRVEGVEVWTYPQWAAKVARRSFRQLPRRESVSTPTSVMRLKRNPALLPVLAAFAKVRPRAVRMEHASTRSETLATRADLEHLFGDSAWMAKVVKNPADVLGHTKVQFSDTTEAEAARGGFRADSLETADGRRIDEGTPMEDANSIDEEDYAVLFELERLRAKARGRSPADLGSYHCLVVDEAQEFAPIELRLMSRSLKRGGTVIVAGDAAQQVDETSYFGGWEQVVEELGAKGAARVVLEVNYRCPPDVTALARSLVDRGPLPGGPAPSITRAAHPHLFHQSVWLLEELRRLEVEDPSASITVVARSAGAARVYARTLRHGTAVRLALGGEFEFRPGLTVTCVPEVKGLEFDYVILPDVNASNYPLADEARRALYVAVTRASHRLVLSTASSWSPLLEAINEGGG